MQTAILGGGCFWCTEAIYQKLKGVVSVESGYSGGVKENPTYDEVSSGKTGHAESIKIEFDENITSFEKILEVFFATHDPTTLNKQGNDVGTQYRSAIFYMDDNQKQIAEDLIKKMTDEKWFSGPIVTEVTKYKNFYKAENYHQNYYNSHKNQPYCNIIISPKLEHFADKFKGDLK